MNDYQTNYRVLYLIDEPIEFDQRVQKSVEKCSLKYIENCSLKVDNLLSFNIIVLLLKSIVLSPLIWIKLYTYYKIKPVGIFHGLKSSIKTIVSAEYYSKNLAKKYRHIKIDYIHANDLFCGIIAEKLKHKLLVNFSYDAHEIEFHRNRKNSFFRVSLDYILEKNVIRNSKELIVVNKKAKKIYSQLYQIENKKVVIINNNHFKPHFNYALDQYNEQNKEISIVYVGGGINGRKLEKLTQDNMFIGINLNGFFLSNIPENALENGWILGSKEYLTEVMELIKNKRCIMWSCVDDICLSYRLSLPNKFFQAIALGIPVIAYKGTYLAEIITQYNLGYIYDDNNLQDIVNDMRINENYEKLLISVSEFQNKLFIEKLEL